MENTVKSKNSSVFRVAIALCLSLYFNNVFIYILISLFLLTFGRKEVLIYLLFLGASILIGNCMSDFVPYGIVDSKNYNYYVIDKFFYKIVLYTNSTLNRGDIVRCADFNRCSEISFLKKNILFSGNTFSSSCSFVPRLLIDRQLNKLSDSCAALIEKIIYNQYIEDEGLKFTIGYGLYSYYFLNLLRRKSPVHCLTAVFLVSVLFCFEVKFILLIFDCLFFKKERLRILSYKLLFICVYNFSLFHNYAIMLPLLFSFIGILKTEYDFRIFLFLIESFFFKEIDLFETIMFNSLIRIKVFLYVFGILVIVFPFLEGIFLSLIGIYSLINKISISIRGSLSLVSIAIFLLLNRTFSINRYLNIALLCLLLLSPFNYPLMNVCFIDVGQGDSAIIRYPLSRSCVLIDTGSKFNYHKLRKTLFAKGIYTIDYLIVSHDDEDHNGNIENLSNDFNIREIIEFGKDFSFRDIDYKYLYLGEFDNDNDNSLAYLINIDGYDFLFTGDLSKKAENMIYTKYGPLKIDFLKVSHHGSYTGTSSYLIGNILPEYAVISTNGKYDHPSEDTIETLDRYMVKYYITKQSGNIDIYFSHVLDFIRTGSNDFVIINKK